MRGAPLGRALFLFFCRARKSRIARSTVPDVRYPWIASSICTTGASVQQPTQATLLIVISPCASVSWSAGMPRLSLMPSITSSAPLTWQAVPTQTLTECFPAGLWRNFE
jgi:hypothetical protein